MRFTDCGGHSENRFAGEKDCALRHGPNFALKAETRKVIKKTGADVLEDRKAAQIINFRSAEAQIFEKVERLVESGGDQEISPRGNERTIISKVAFASNPVST